ncbi:formylglycine-generating enzyme family protein [Oleiharenicola lentus]|uniref:formylglycine-generating enzyme family protein n=1 Tax=Oleiharenicola lentus TaxID=2508720 RepID=UPI003F66B619
MRQKILLKLTIAPGTPTLQRHSIMLRHALSFIGLLVAASVLPATEAAPAPRGKTPSPGANFQVAAPDIAMIWVEPGTFLASSPLAQEDDTLVTLSRGYWLSRTEITEEQWLAVVSDVALVSRRGAHYPADQLQWESAMRFCQLLTARERAAGRLPTGYNYALPTEAQWEYACRAGTTGPFSGDPDAMAWHRENSGGQLHPVAQKLPNAWGFYDMHGNVVEWCLDYYESYPGGSVTDPVGPVIEQFRIVRGGSVGSGRGGCRSGVRLWGRSASKGINTGFRVALVPEPVAKPAETR